MKESEYLEGQDQVVKRIKNIPVFNPFSEEKLKGLLRLSKLAQYKPNEIIILEGSREKLIYFLISGSVKVEKNGKFVAKIEKNGEVFGEMGFLEDEPRSSTVKAVQDTVCLAVDVSYLLKIQAEGKDSFYSAIYKMFAQILANRLRQTTIKLDNFKKENDCLKKEIDKLKGVK